MILMFFKKEEKKPVETCLLKFKYFFPTGALMERTVRDTQVLNTRPVRVHFRSIRYNIGLIIRDCVCVSVSVCVVHDRHTVPCSCQ